MKKTLICSLITIFLIMCFLPALVFGGSGVVRLNYVKPGVSFKIYRIGGFNGSGAFDVDDDFKGYGIDFENTEAAQTLAAYIERDNIPEEGQAATGSDSAVVFSGLESGYYLILGETYNDGEYVYTALPVMITVYEGEVIEVSGKYEMTDLSSDDNYQSISALKVWSGTSLESITVQLLRDGEVYDEQTLNSDGNWRYTWTGLDLVHTWTVTEKDIPSGYSLSIEKDGQVYILLNTKDSDTPGGEATTEAKTEATTEAKTETTTKKPSGGGGGGGSVVVNPEETTEAAVETTTESDSESGTESETEEEEITEEDVEDTTEKKNDDSDDDDNSDNDDSGDESDDGGNGGSDSSSEGATDEFGNRITESQMGDNSGMYGDSSASSSSASVSSDSSSVSSASADSASSSSAGAASGVSVSSSSSARLPQTGQLWFPVPILSCCGVFLLILGIGRRRMSE